jgi:hypothetical protein
VTADLGFLARWSRRKREAQRAPAEQPQPVGAHENHENKKMPDVPARATPSEQTHSPPKASLPPIDFSQPGALQALLRAGMPAELTRDILRKAWRSDPAIHDFIGLSENSFDFTAPDLGGFGPLSADQVRQLLARTTESMEGKESTPQCCAQAQPVQSLPDTAAAPAADRSTPVAKEGAALALQHENFDRMAAKPRAKRHGGALPE